MAKALKTGFNQKQIKYALVADNAGTFTVYKLCENYASHVRGGIASTWRYVAKGLDRDKAEALFSKRLAGRK